MKGCSFTGHRDIAPERMKRLENLVERAIAYAYGEGCRNFYSGGALGFDTLCAKAVLKFRIKNPDARLVMVLPCISQADGWDRRQISTYEYILSCADEVIYTSEEYTDGCMKKRNAYLAEVCDILIAYSGRERSGSAQTVRMAQKLGKTVYNLYKTVNSDN